MEEKTENKTENKRNASLDVLRLCAFFFVACVHFYLNSGFYDTVTEGTPMLVMWILRSLPNTCVALFLMLSGYLMTNKTVSRKYYSGLPRILVTYLLCSLFCILYKARFLGTGRTAGGWLRTVLDYTASDYAWYIEMYLGLFLMIPFLNSAYHGLKSQKEKLILILSFLLLTSLPGLLNTFDLSTPGWWADPGSSNHFTKLLPAWWTGFYPVTYYFLGSYLREYPITGPRQSGKGKMKKSTCLLLLILFCAAAGVYNYYRMHGIKFYWGAFLTNASPLVVVPAVLFFELIAESGLKLPEKAGKVLGWFSGLTLGAFLCAPVFDHFVYSRFKMLVPEVSDRWIWAPVTVTAVFLLSLSAAAVIEAVRLLLGRGFGFCRKKLKEIGKEKR